MFDWLVVGAGFAGSVLAERLASQRGERVMVIDRRPHVGGNAFDHLSRFTRWRPYEHRVLAEVVSPLTGKPVRVPMPINLDTVNRLYGLSLSEHEVEGWMAARAERVPEVRTSEDVVVSKVGRELYEMFFRGYTRKQWALDPSELDKSVTARVPTRTNRDDRYFTDAFQAMPLHGYTRMFERMLAHPNIAVRTGMDYEEARWTVPHRRLVWTGPLDEFFGFRFGKLPYRSLHFEHQTVERERFQPVGTVNYPAEEVPYTRISEYKHITGQRHPFTSITYEYPRAEGEPYYPIPRPENQALYKRYEALADAATDVWFVGRLATYRYYNMDQIVGQALATFGRIDASLPPRAANDGLEAQPGRGRLTPAPDAGIGMELSMRRDTRRRGRLAWLAKGPRRR